MMILQRSKSTLTEPPLHFHALHIGLTLLISRSTLTEPPLRSPNSLHVGFSSRWLWLSVQSDPGYQAAKAEVATMMGLRFEEVRQAPVLQHY